MRSSENWQRMAPTAGKPGSLAVGAAWDSLLGLPGFHVKRSVHITQPLEHCGAYCVRVHDPSCDLVVTHYAADKGGIDYATQRGHAQLDRTVWAVSRYDIPPSWETAYYRVAGVWPDHYDQNDQKAG